MGDITRVATVGCGTIGSAWAALFAAHGHEVTLYDVDPAALARGHSRAEAMLAQLAAFELCSIADADAGKRRLHASYELDALADAQLIQESAPEDYAIKATIHRAIEGAVADDAIIASSSSGLLTGRMQEALAHPERLIVAHPFNPPHLIPLVELVPGAATDPALAARLEQFYRSLGKTPVVLRKEVPGYLGNRLAAAVWREATDLVANGVASLEDVDKALYAGLGPRYAFMGQHLIYHMNGGRGGYAEFFDKLIPSYAEPVLRDLASWTSTPPAAKAEVLRQIDEQVGDRTMEDLQEWRDQTLARVLKATRSEQPAASA